MEMAIRRRSAASPLRGTPSSEERAALRAFRHAALSSRAYRAHLERHGIDHRNVTRLSEVPFTDKRTVFTDDIDDWLDGGRVSDAAELLASSGSSGLFSVGVTSRSEHRSQERAIDSALRALGAGDDTTTLLLNCLPMGITIPTRLATVATPSVHIEMAVELLARAGTRFDRVVIAAEPLFLKEFGETALRSRGAGFAERVAACFVGGEWISESWRDYVSELFGFPASATRERPGVLISMGAAEMGLHALVETPALRLARGICDTADARLRVFGEDRGYAPSIFTWDPKRFHMEERVHEDGVHTLVVTALGRRLLPLVRYDLDDEALLIDPRVIDAELARAGIDMRAAGPVAAVWGRNGSAISGPGWTLRPEAVKEGLFKMAAHAAVLTGRFRIMAGDGLPEVHVQLRDRARPSPGLTQALAEMASTTAGVPALIRVHEYREYPFHEAGDFQHKAVYL